MEIAPSPNATLIKYFTQNKDVDRYILSLLSYRDILRVCQASKYTQELCQDASLWRNKIMKDFPLRSEIYYSEYIRLWYEDPKELYRIINQPSKIIFLEDKDFPELYDIYFEQYNSETATKAILPNLPIMPLLRGDVVHLAWIGDYRNEGKLIWTGKKLVELYFEIDDYGSVPPEFQFPEFPFDHFHESIEHDTILWLSASTVEEAINNYDVEKQVTRISDSYHSYYPIFTNELNLNYELKSRISKISKEEFAIMTKKEPFIRQIEDKPFYVIGYRETIPDWVNITQFRY